MRTRVSIVDPEKMNAHAQSKIPSTPTESLMECAPFEEPAESGLEKMLRLEPVKRAIEALEPRERYVIEAKFWRGLGTRIVSREMGVSHQTVHRLTKKAMANLEAVLRKEYMDD